MNRLLAVAIVCSQGLCGQAEDGSSSNLRLRLDDANQHLVRRDVKRYEETLRRAWQSEGEAPDRVEAGVALARALCRIHHNPVESRKVLAAAEALGAKPALPLIELATLETFEGDYAAACRERARCFACLGIVLLATPRSHDPRPRSELPRDFGDLVLVDGQWTYRALPYTEPGEVLARLLPTFTGATDDSTREQVVRALAGSRFYPEAAALALRWKLTPDQTLRDIIMYGRWTDNLSRRLAEEYRRHALGGDYRTHLRIPFILDMPVGRTTLEKVMTSESKRLWQKRHPDTAFRAAFQAMDPWDESP